MKSDGKQFGKQQPKPAELGTENRRTHDAKPKTLNTKQETSDPRGPIFAFVPSFQSRVLPQAKMGRSGRRPRQPNFPFWFCVSGFEFCLATSEFLPQPLPDLGQDTAQFALSDVRAQREANRTLDAEPGTRVVREIGRPGCRSFYF